MPLEAFLAEHLAVVMVVLYVALNWAADHKLLTPRQFVAGVGLLTLLGVYLGWTREGFGVWLLLPIVVAGGLLFMTWRSRPRPLNGSHEAL